MEKTEIGKKIVTRSVKKEFEAEDITHHYKHSDKSIMDFFKRKFQDDVEINLNIPDHIKVNLHCKWIYSFHYDLVWRCNSLRIQCKE